jgi:hypothetical protein
MSSGLGRILTGDPNDLLYLKEKCFMGKFIDKSRNFSEQYINDYNHLPIRFLRRKLKNYGREVREKRQPGFRGPLKNS